MVNDQNTEILMCSGLCSIQTSVLCCASTFTLLSANDI